MITHKARNAQIAQKYKLPEMLTGYEIAALSMGAFANHRFLFVPTGEHITAISDCYVQLLKDGKPRDFRERDDAKAFADIMGSPFSVSSEFDPTW